MTGESVEVPRPLTGSAALAYVVDRLKFPLEELLRFPKFFCLDPTSICNARCLMCGVDRKKVRPMRMSQELFEKVAAELGRWAGHLERVGLFVICEPLTDPRLEEKIAALKRAGIRCTFLNSNMSLLTGDRARSLMAAGLDRLYMSIDSIHPDRYERIRAGLSYKEVYANALEFIRLRNELKPDLMIRIQMVLQPANADEAEAFRDWWAGKIGPNDQVVVTRVYNWQKVNDPARLAERDQINALPCYALWSTLEVQANGDVYLCCVDVEPAYRLGNLNETTIEEIWRGPTLAKVRQMHLDGERPRIPICDGCAVWPGDQKHAIGPSQTKGGGHGR